MQISVSSTLTLYYDGQFWVGIIEHIEDNEYRVARIVFGQEPSNEAILQFVIENWQSLSFSPSCCTQERMRAKNPKRRLREAAKVLSRPATSTKAQQALAAQRDTSKRASAHAKSFCRRQKKQLQFEVRTMKRKQKKRGH